MNAETLIGIITALVGLLGAIAGLIQILHRTNSPPAAIANPGDLDDHLIDELVNARVELMLLKRDVSHERGPAPGAP